MFIIKVLLHHVLFLVSVIAIRYYFDLNVYITLLSLIHVYCVSYYVSLWTIKFVFLFPCTKIKTENKCIVITGCDTGFGHQTALLSNRIGFKVFATCLDPNGKGATELMNNAENSAKMIVIGMDVTNEKDVLAAYETVKKSMTNTEQLFGLVNNAGITLTSEFEWGADLNAGKRVIEVNLMGMLNVTRTFLPLIRQSKGRIINIESFAALMPITSGIFYGISKYAAKGFTDNLRSEMYKFGVSVASVQPLYYKTPLLDVHMLEDQYEHSFRTSSEEVRQAYGETFMEREKKAIAALKGAFNPNAVTDVIISALTVYEPDPCYIVAPLIILPVLKLLLWLSKESQAISDQTKSWLKGTHKIYTNQ